MNKDGATQIVAALSIVHDPLSTNTARQEAQQFLDRVENEPESPFWGYQLAVEPDNSYVRHFGLTLLQRSIRNNLETYDLEKALALRSWVVELCGKVESGDPAFIKEKLATNWVEIAKRTWGSFLERDSDEDATSDDKATAKTDSDLFPGRATETELLHGWVSMDKDLVALWDKNLATRELALIIFRTLFEDVYILEDAVATRRSRILTSLIVEVLTSNDILSRFYNRSEDSYRARATDEGWIVKWTELLDQCLQNGCQDKQSEVFASRVLATLKCCFHWIFPEVLRKVDILTKLGTSLSTGIVKIQILATDCFHAIFTRRYENQDDFNELIGSIFRPDGVQMLLQVFRNTKIDPESIDIEAYSLVKKIVELGVGLGAFLGPPSRDTKAIDTFTLPESSDILGYLKFVLETSCHESLIVSGLSLSFWLNALRADALSHEQSEFFTVLPDLLNVAADRLLNYEDLSSEHVSHQYFQVDFDSEPDSLQFITGYKKYLEDIIRISVCKASKDGLMWLENRLAMFFQSEMGSKALNTSKFKYDHGADESYVVAVAQFSITEACIKGISRWEIWYGNRSDKVAKQQELTLLVEELFQQLVQVEFQDPMLSKKQIQTLVHFAPLLSHKSDLLLTLLEKILNACTFAFPKVDFAVDDAEHIRAVDDVAESVRDLRSSSGTELNKLAFLVTEALSTRLDELKTVINNLIATKDVSPHEIVAFKSFLLVLSLRSNLADKKTRFSELVDQDLAVWSEPVTIKALGDLHWFMERLGIVRIAEYFKSRGIVPETDLLQTKMDAEGRLLKSELKVHWATVFPIRAVRIYLQYSIERLEPDSEAFAEMVELWKPRVVPLLPYVLQLLHQTQEFHNPQKWRDLPVEVQRFVRDSCVERFWQMGISSQSKDSFVDENVKAAYTLRDFADSLGHVVRYTREYTFLTIVAMSSLGECFYSVPDLAEKLWKSLVGDCEGINLHSWKHMTHIVIRGVVKNCPKEFISSFLQDLLSRALPFLDQLLMEKWKTVLETGVQISGTEEELSEEMKEEHFLRQLTTIVVRLLVDLLGNSQRNATISERHVAIRQMIYNNGALLESVLRLMAHIISFRDTKCTFNSILILRSVVREIMLKDENLDKWLCNEMFEKTVAILTDNHYQDTHSEAASLLCDMYLMLRSKYAFPKTYLQQLCGSSDAALANMERMLRSSKNYRQQRNYMMQFVVSKQTESFQAEQRKIAINKKKKADHDILNQSLTEDGEGVLGNLFG